VGIVTHTQALPKYLRTAQSAPRGAADRNSIHFSSGHILRLPDSDGRRSGGPANRARERLRLVYLSDRRIAHALRCGGRCGGDCENAREGSAPKAPTVLAEAYHRRMPLTPSRLSHVKRTTNRARFRHPNKRRPADTPADFPALGNRPRPRRFCSAATSIRPSRGSRNSRPSTTVCSAPSGAAICKGHSFFDTGQTTSAIRGSIGAGLAGANDKQAGLCGTVGYIHFCAQRTESDEIRRISQSIHPGWLGVERRAIDSYQETVRSACQRPKSSVIKGK